MIGSGCDGQPSPGAMKILCLNCRGLGRPEAGQELRSLVKLHRPWVVFLSETRFYHDRVDKLQRQLCLDARFGMGSHVRGGGLTLLWSRHVDVKIKSYDRDSHRCNCA